MRKNSQGFCNRNVSNGCCSLGGGGGGVSSCLSSTPPQLLMPGCLPPHFTGVRAPTPLCSWACKCPGTSGGEPSTQDALDRTTQGPGIHSGINPAGGTTNEVRSSLSPGKGEVVGTLHTEYGQDSGGWEACRPQFLSSNNAICRALHLLLSCP